MKDLRELKLEAAFETIATKFNTTTSNVMFAYLTDNKNVQSMVYKMTGLK